ncbi:abasic site processing protein HMCES-like isoform X1 [Polyodon spathula]|uniref:abasic site processing protein HMCES-like isoform X1 n=1 Tax=Polyodon spathula TaxID=7913 RepID=UPI001B7E7C32|nr:abasic site processing protein HMCES-like isoform X1 [Polyodon spathula]XP_041080278.1 abasic site processing protein HMCES-like isoform X1 [Polyodon spathula]XP_041080279.1 abasic site processing protein HMCES-like isoform X1 [Polyodon spathula]
MCGRTACTLAPVEVSAACSYRDRQGRIRCPAWRDGDQDKYRPSYNKSPQSNSPVLVSRSHFSKGAASEERVIAAMRWGLVPSWFQESSPSKMQYSTSNCRSEGMMQKKSYKDPLLRGKRCVILADGFYEWKRQDKEKQPYFIYFPQATRDEEEVLGVEGEDSEEWRGWRLLTMAGLFDCWTPPGGGEPLYTYTIITVGASRAMDWVHDRMPAILDGEEAVRQWLDFGAVKPLEAMKLIHPTEALCLHPVSSIVNNSRNNTPECIQPIELGVKKEAKPSASSKMMLNWLKTESPKKEGGATESPARPPKKQQEGGAKRGSEGLMQAWLRKAESCEPAKKPRTN